MKRIVLRTAAVCGLIIAALAGYAQTLTVTSPNNGDFLGLSNQLKFNVTGASTQVNIKATITGPGGVQFTSENDFTPDADGKINDQLPINFNQGAPEGAYTIDVVAKRKSDNGVFGNVSINVTVDVNKPKFLQFNPLNNSFVKGIVPITVKVLEPNFKDYRVQINGSDIPNNTGTSLVNDSFTVLWDTTGIQFDGSQTVSIRLRDEANNEETKTITVTLDRVAPVVGIVQPLSNIKLSMNSSVSVAIDMQDGSANSIDVTGVDVVVRKLDGTFLARVPRSSFKNTGGNNFRWSGKLRFNRGYGKQFKIVVNVVDRAGNASTTQEVVVTYK
ncbi:MAG: hypothetical protein KF784_07430 [Fimbriimonadaceae bacterium]|nr:hypothetical protein [Fimbriimonadaceae bacterium]